MRSTATRAGGLRVFLSAGEVSGDHYGAEIMQHLAAHEPGIFFTGLGGLAMETAGQERVVRAEEVAVMGITEILAHVPRIYGAYRRLVRSVLETPPDIAILIDFPDVNFRLARHLRRLGVPVVWFASPQLWAWKRRRLRWVQSRVDRMLVLFPFEQRFYQARDVDAEFVGHPLAHQNRSFLPREEFAKKHGLDPDVPWLALLPGSRRREVVANLPAQMQAAAALREQLGALEIVIPVASGLDKELIGSLVSQAALGGAPPKLLDDAAEALHHARAAAVASGTATVLAAVIGTPFVVVYRTSATTLAIARLLVRYPPEIPAEPDPVTGLLPIAMVNLLAGERIVPELLNQHFTPEALTRELLPLLKDSPARAQQLERLAQVRSSLLRESAVFGTARVAEVALGLLGGAQLRSAPSTRKSD